MNSEAKEGDIKRSILFHSKANGIYLTMIMSFPYVTHMLFHIKTILLHHVLCISDKNTNKI